MKLVALAGGVADEVPLPLDTHAIREALNSPDPAVALAVALVAFHSLTAKQVAELRLADIADGRLSLDGRTIPLAEPVRVRLSAWLDHCARRWPNSVNPYLLSISAPPRLLPVKPRYPWQRTTIRPQALREDRILNEIHATSGDIRRICDLFDLSVAAASRYHATITHPDLTAPGDRVP